MARFGGLPDVARPRRRLVRLWPFLVEASMLAAGRTDRLPSGAA